MAKKSTKTTASGNLPVLRIGSRIRCTDDGVEGRITWANAAAVKIEWADGEKVTWKRDSLATRPIEIIDADAEEAPPAAATTPEGGDVAATATPPAETTTETPVVETAQPDANVAATEAIIEPATVTETPPPERPANIMGKTAEGHLIVSQPEVIAAEPAAETPAKPKRQRKTPAEPKEKKPSALDAAARVLAEAGQAMTCKEMIGAMAAKGYWTSPGGKTPEATLCSSMLREINTKGDQSRFVKTAPGRFAFKA